MEITNIKAEQISKMFLAGAMNLDSKKEWINELNVFPVPDGDTGTNMSMTIMSAAKEVNSLENPTMADVAKAISSGSLRGARGNSGVILSPQPLFHGPGHLAGIPVGTGFIATVYLVYLPFFTILNIYTKYDTSLILTPAESIIKHFFLYHN